MKLIKHLRTKQKEHAQSVRMHAVFLMMLTIIMVMTGCGSSLEPSGQITKVHPLETSDAYVTETGKNNLESSNLKVHFIDVGQGDSILIESDHRYMLVDAGENDQGEKVVSYLQEQGVEQLDYVIGTHPHSDHIGGLDVVIRNMAVNKVILPKKQHNTKTFEDVLTAVAEKGLKITAPKNKDTYSLGNAKFEIISLDKDYGDELNNWSVGIKVTYGENTFIMCGDAEAEAEEDMANANIELSADVLKLSHHGSSTSTATAFLKKVNPTYAIISLGKDNSYHHPHPSTLKKLDGIQIYRTDELGTIIATSDGKTITWEANNNINEQENNTANKPLENSTTSSKVNSEFVYISDTGKKYHRTVCRYLKDTDISISLTEAKAKGLEPCSVCKPAQ